MVKITVEFSTDNALFVEDNAYYELRYIAQQVSHVITDELGSQSIFDSNGNKIGKITVKKDKK